MQTSVRVGAVAAVFAISMLAAACGDDDATPTLGSTTAPSSDGADVTIADFTFSALPVSAGAEVTVANDDSTAHTVTADDDSFDSGNIGAGSSGTVTAPDAPGEYPFHCEIHKSMTGTLVVG
jgi:plastocyanin